MVKTISFTLNGKAVRLEVEEDRSLLQVLRTDLGLTGTKYGCGEGYCGACTVLLDGEAVRSCRLAVSDIEGRTVITVEGLEINGKLHPLQAAFVEHDAMQCGYCTPGMLLTAWGLQKKNPHPTREQVIAGLDDNLCRCGAHTRIIDAVLSAAAKGEVK